ncbi:venom protease-like isoform X2 [Anticarsia gemmatalis]|uniref:venom protease-like isoform X2 n=1 Tax=Anticarsia gemmatalis TaxID=129554 RepID=UPI003F76BD9C
MSSEARRRPVQIPPRSLIYEMTALRLTIINPNIGILSRSGTSKAKDKCIQYIHTLNYPCKLQIETEVTKTLDPKRNCHVLNSVKDNYDWAVAGGEDAQEGQYPHMALIGFGNTLSTADWLCGGTVISERFILTAAHCKSAPKLGPAKFVAVGLLRRSDINTPGKHQMHYISRFITYPLYMSPFQHNDIALIETVDTIQFSSKVLPACLHTDDIVDDTANATGWGDLKKGTPQKAETLQTVTLQRFSEEECSIQYDDNRLLPGGYDGTTQLCYGHRTLPKDTCNGDSGGPIQSTKHEVCVYTILGVTSFGSACGFPGNTGVYARVKHYVPWIEDIVWPDY